MGGLGNGDLVTQVLSGAFFLFMVYLTGMSLLGALYILFGWRVARSEAVPLESVPRPARLNSAVQYLSGLGFELIGVERVRLYFFSRPEYEWVCASADRHIYAEVVQLRKTENVWLLFLTRFADDAMLLTGYPFGENIDTPTFHSHAAVQSLENAYDYHREQVAALEREHGAPVLVHTLADALQSDEVYRKRYRRRNNRRLMVGHFTNAVGALVMALAGGLLFLSAVPGTLPPRVANNVLVTFTGTLFVGILGLKGVHRLLFRPAGAIDAAAEA